MWDVESTMISGRRNLVEILYTSSDLHAAIARVLSDPGPHDRRVVMVAYVGGRAEAFLPHPDGLEIVCCLQPGATDALTLDRLRKRQAKIFKSDRLHMKVYWSSKEGCVICSANASGSALGGTSQKEAGVFLPVDTVDIDRLWKYAAPKRINDDDLRRLTRDTERIPRRPVARPDEEKPDFLEWYGSRLNEWKLGWWTEGAGIAEKSSKEAKQRFGVLKPADILNIQKGTANSYDWMLSYYSPDATWPRWLYVDFVVKLDASYPDFDKTYCYQAVQANLRKDCPREPFKLDRAFKSAFKKSLRDFGAAKVEGIRSLRPPEQLLKSIAVNMGKQELR
jgi:hypothetical protein